MKRVWKKCAMTLAAVMICSAAAHGRAVMTAEAANPAASEEAPGFTLSYPEGTVTRTDSEGYTYVFLESIGESIPYVICGTESIPQESYFDALCRLMEKNCSDLVILQEPREVTAGGRRMQECVFGYSISGHSIRDTRLFTEVDHVLYTFGAKEIPEAGYELGNLLYEIAGSLAIDGELKPGAGGKDEILLPGRPRGQGTGSDTVGQGIGSDTLGQETAGETGSDTTGQETVSAAGERVYHFTSIVDTETGKPMGRVYAPAGYTVESKVGWFSSGISAPARLAAEATSPDRAARMGFSTEINYKDDQSYLNGEETTSAVEGQVDTMNMTTFQARRDASAYCDMFAGAMLPENAKATVAGLTGPTREQQKLLDKKTAEANAQLQNVTQTTSIVESKADYSYAQKVYSTTLPGPDGGDAEYRLMVRALVFRTESLSRSSYEGTQIYGLSTGYDLTISYCSWGPRFICYLLAPADEFDRYEEVFDNFCANTGACDFFGVFNDGLGWDVHDEEEKLMAGLIDAIDLEGLVRKNAEKFLTADTYLTKSDWQDVTFGTNDFLTSAGDRLKAVPEDLLAYTDAEGDIYLLTEDEAVPSGLTQLRRPE